MYCAECGTALPESAKFCLECGHKREAALAAPEPAITPSAHNVDGRPIDSTRDVWGKPLSLANESFSEEGQAMAGRVDELIGNPSPFWDAVRRANAEAMASSRAALPSHLRFAPVVANLEPREVSLTPGYLAIAAAVLVIVGSLGPWVSMVAPYFGSLTMSGTDGDGKLSLGCGLAASVLLGFLVTSHRSGVWLGLLAAIAFGIAAAIGIYDWQNLSEAVGADDEVAVFARVGWGLQAMTLGAITGTILSITQAVRASALS